MMLYLISIGVFCVSDLGKKEKSFNNSEVMIATFLNNVLLKGYTLDKKSIDYLSTLSVEDLKNLYTEVYGAISAQNGDSFEWSNSFYKNFPEEVLSLTDSQLLINSILYYWLGIENTEEKVPRPPIFEVVPTPKVIKLVGEDFLAKHALDLINSSIALQPIQLIWLKERLLADNSLIIYTLKKDYKNRDNKATILAYLVGQNLITFEEAIMYMSTPTDILKFLSCLGGTLPTLGKGEKVELYGLRKPQLKATLKVLESFENLSEDIPSHENLWKNFYKIFKVNRYLNRFPNVSIAFAVLWEEIEFRNFNSQVEKLFEQKELQGLLNLLSTRPTEFGLRIDRVLRNFVENSEVVLASFEEIANRCSITQLFRLFKFYSSVESSNKLFMPKSSSGKAYSRTQYKTVLVCESVRQKVLHLTEKAILDKYKKQASGDHLSQKIFIDPRLANYAVPQVLRNLSPSSRPVVRNSRFTIEADKVLRLFVYWKEGLCKDGTLSGRIDLDHSVTFYKKDWTSVDVWYGNLKENFAYQSGDVTSAPDGAAEYTDIDLKSALQSGFRYALMSVTIYTGQENFDNLPIVRFGWMEREEPNSGELFEPQTVIQSVDLTGNTKFSMVAVIDLEVMQVIWVDLCKKTPFNLANNVETAKASALTLVKAIVETENTLNLYRLFTWWANANGQIVESDEEADLVFSTDDEKSCVNKHNLAGIIANYIPE